MVMFNPQVRPCKITTFRWIHLVLQTSKNMLSQCSKHLCYSMKNERWVKNGIPGFQMKKKQQCMTSSTRLTIKLYNMINPINVIQSPKLTLNTIILCTVQFHLLVYYNPIHLVYSNRLGFVGLSHCNHSSPRGVDADDVPALVCTQPHPIVGRPWKKPCHSEPGMGNGETIGKPTREICVIDC